ncbi:hypothetical protein FP026_09130 [Rhizobium tropici]|uniref:Uncharacterized protein n=1 Tax=Rhizobium tropici TaxID=398 RepID=A0A5B0W5G8_RHITR|nr:DUF6331 family protein [Rhizobium tropici]KAA1182236.1 hypothetical protein FP026_09130 [Rhizobium tropici]
MNLDHPLLGLIKNCETMCEAACCGRDAFDFSPIHVASFLLRYSGCAEDDEVAKIRLQLDRLAEDSRQLPTEGGTISIAEMNQLFTGEELAELSAIISTALDQALQLISIAEQMPRIS